jgi:SAM-dependent methyltransferase
MAQKAVELILPRQLASYLAMASFVADPAGTLLYYSEPAEALLGRRYDETGELSLPEWATLFHPTAKDGSPLPPDALPLVRALQEAEGVHLVPVEPQPFAGFTAPAARRYAAWYRSPAGARMAHEEETLLGGLLAWLPGARSVMDVGCGTGHFTRWLAARGLDAIGLDVVPAMLTVARDASSAARYLQATGEQLPFRDRSVDLVAFITTLEFIADPAAALREAARVARVGLLLGVLNLASPLGIGRKLAARLAPSPYRAARLPTPWGLACQVQQTLGERVSALCWATAVWPGWVPAPLRRLPCGAFIGMAVRLQP